VPGRWTEEHLELAARYEWFDPKAAANPDEAAGIRSQVAGSGYASPSGQATQARSILTTGANIYFAGHDFKLQLNYVRRTELENWAKSVPDPTLDFALPASREVDDDSFVAQLTYRL
jgi:hypothetical protein